MERVIKPGDIDEMMRLDKIKQGKNTYYQNVIKKAKILPDNLFSTGTPGKTPPNSSTEKEAAAKEKSKKS